MAPFPTILVIDDEPDMLWVLESVLRSQNFDVIKASTGAEALALAPKTELEIAFLDAKLPDMEGLEIARLIKLSHPSTQLIMISGYYYEHDDKIQDALRTGLIVHFIPKPFSNSTIIEALKTARSALGRQNE
ncbi:MAG: response regulator [Deltaproteobacteria bacterium]|nr:response regulator [Deltaproteobacteria bacterium]